jgi:hypothetical protein
MSETSNSPNDPLEHDDARRLTPSNILVKLGRTGNSADARQI